MSSTKPAMASPVRARERETAKIDRVPAYLADVRLRDGPLRTSTWEANRVLGLQQRER